MKKGLTCWKRPLNWPKSEICRLTLHLLGYSYRPLHKSVHTYGPYEVSEFASKLETIKPDLVWLPAVWPETYSYTLSESLFEGLPVLVPDLGAFPERVVGRSWAQVYPWNSSAETMVDLLSSLKAKGITEASVTPPSTLSKKYDTVFYQRSYLQGISTNKKAPAYYLSNEWLTSFLAPKSSENVLTGSEKVLVKIFQFRLTRAGRILSQMIPIQF
ncbi:MAG: hypothetical protein KDA77_12765 [Planctomycetaceae bacterium]|nr:hypothetical protein [Planctomycetaceae bacterium]